jgi:CheY-like chemotaxis protein
VVEAADGRAALAILERDGSAVDLLLTDVVMPGMNGCELASGLTALLPGIKVMFMSAYDRDFLVARGFVPTGPVITKPFTVEYLSRRVRMVLTDRPTAATAPLTGRAG